MKENKKRINKTNPVTKTEEKGEENFNGAFGKNPTLVYGILDGAGEQYYLCDLNPSTIDKQLNYSFMHLTENIDPYYQLRDPNWPYGWSKTARTVGYSVYSLGLSDIDNNEYFLAINLLENERISKYLDARLRHTINNINIYSRFMIFCSDINGKMKNVNGEAIDKILSTEG